MNAKTRITRRVVLTPWLAAGVAVLVLGLAGPVGSARAAESFVSDAVAEQAIVNPTPAGKPGSGPIVAQPGNPCLGAAPPRSCNPRPNDPPPAPTATSTAKVQPPTNTPTPRPKPPTSTPTAVPPTDTPTPKPKATNTPVPEPTATPVPPTSTPIPEPTATPVPPTNTPVPEPTATPVPPTNTPMPEPTATPMPPTNTPVPEPTATPVPPTATPTPKPKLPTNTPVPQPTATPVVEVTIDEPEPEVAPEPPAAEPVVEEPTVEPTMTPASGVATPAPPAETSTPTATPTFTPTPVVIAAIGEPPATAPADSIQPIEPTGELEVASSPMNDPSPFVPLGTLLFALAAAAGQMLRADPLMFRRLVPGFDGVKRAPGTGGGENGATTMGTQSPAGLGGQGGGPDSLAKGSPNGLDHLAKGSSNGFDGLANGSSPHGFDSLASGGPSAGESSIAGAGDPSVGYDAAANAGGQVPDVQADALGDAASRPTDWGTGQPAPSEPVTQGPAGGSLGGGGGAGGSELARVPGTGGSELAHNGLGGSQGGDLMARGLGSGGDVLANGAGGSGHGFSQAAPFGGDAGTAGSGLGGGHGFDGVANGIGQGLTPAGDAASLPSTPGVQDVALHGSSGGEADLAESLETLAKAVSSLDGGTVADAGMTTAPGDPTMAASGFDPSWLGAGALARAPRLDPLPKSFRCPQCRRPLVYGHRFCGYCGEPLDKTMA